MKASSMKIDDNVYWVGVLDWNIRTYHGYTLHGTTYNCFLIFGEEKTVLIDNTYPGTSAQLFGRIYDAFEKEAKEPKIDVIIQNHIENDHSGSLYEMIQTFPEAEVYASPKGVPGLKEQYPELEDIEIKMLKTGDEMDIGGDTLSFILAPMLHWPDSMFTLLNGKGILFSNDAFGQHICFSERYDYEIAEDFLMESAQKYYANLLTPLSPMVLRKLKEVEDAGLLDKIKIIAPSHGQIWTEPLKIIQAYQDWATGVCKNKVTVFFDTMHHSTETMAQSLIEGAIAGGAEVRCYCLTTDERSEIVKDILDSKAVFVGAPTMFNKPFPSLGDPMYYLEGLSFDKTGLKRKAVTFGSKGWGGGSVRTLSERLEEFGFDVVGKVETNFKPSEKVLDECFKIGKEVAESMKE